jgi:photosystem II stability/assembly factor-like uncharacterized protein
MLKRGAAILILLAVVAAGAAQAQWVSLGPFGGNARALAYDPSSPDHILLASGGGTLFESLDGGSHWHPFAQLGPGHELMPKAIVLDPAHSGTIYVGGWSITGSGGGFFLTHDGGRSWREPAALRGKSIQGLALATSDPRILVAAALDGVYRSRDRGESWERITPTNDADLKNFESVAIDPSDPQIIYAGTWHLPWKTTDGGQHWSSIKQGVIDDSDVFSIILSHGNPQTVFASACSGIYRSDNGGLLFRKVQGIPSSARRTRVLHQDPADVDTVYAGTTEGLWKTTDGGKIFKRISPADFILNDVLVDPRNSKRLLVATDRGGVFASDDAGQTFHPSNDGFSQRQITAVVADPKEPSDLYVSVVNDKQFGGVFHHHSGQWTQLVQGLGAEDVFDLQRSPDGQLVAATNHGLYRFEAGAQRWEPSRTLLVESKAATTKARTSKTALRKARPAPEQKHFTRSSFDGRAMALALGSRKWYAATSAGILMSDNHGATWSAGPTDGAKEFYSVSAHERTVAATTLGSVWYSTDEGEHWSDRPLPSWVTRIYTVTVAGDDGLWLATREGALHWRRSATGGGDWERVLNGLPEREVISIRADGDYLLAGAASSNTVYVSRNQGQSWVAEVAAAVEVTGAVMQGERLYLISRQHGVLGREAATSAAGLRAKLASN